MIHIISKFAPVPFYPLGLALLCIAAAIVLLLRNRRRTAAWLLTATLAQLWFFSCPFGAHLIVGPLERRHYPLHEYPRVSAVVVLGGAGVAPMAPRKFPETNAFGDRLMHAARVFRTGCAPYLITTGGKLEFVHDFEGTEAGNVARLMNELFDIDSSRILLGSRSRNTREDAEEVIRLLAQHNLQYSVLLVTSAVHMDRSSKIFRKLGIDVLEAPTDYSQDTFFQWKLLAFLPSTDSANSVYNALHEYYGILAYRLLGWI